MASDRDQPANRPRPGEPHGGRHRGQRATDLRLDRKGSGGGRPAGRVSRADGHGLPGRGPVAEAALPRRRPGGRGRDSPPRSARSSPWSASPSAMRPPTTPSPCWRTARSSAVYRKVLLPNYGVFDERRYFEPGDTPALIEVAGARVGLTICEDIWYPGPPASVEALAGASLIVNPSASPYQRGRGAYRERMVQERARETGAAFAVCNLVGGQDELVFDGHSVIVSQDGRDAGSRRPVRRGARRLRPGAGRESGHRAGGRGRARAGEARPAGATAPLLARLEAPAPSGQRRAASRRAAGAGCGGL